MFLLQSNTTYFEESFNSNCYEKDLTKLGQLYFFSLLQTISLMSIDNHQLTINCGLSSIN
jgi:hypothetical protein